MSCDVIWFAERDIDLWLAEELRVNSAFASWFLEMIGNTCPVSVPASRTRTSVLDEVWRETDVEALFSLPGKKKIRPPNRRQNKS